MDRQFVALMNGLSPEQKATIAYRFGVVPDVASSPPPSRWERFKREIGYRIQAARWWLEDAFVGRGDDDDA